MDVDGAKDKSATPPSDKKKRDSSPTPSEVALAQKLPKKRKKVRPSHFRSLMILTLSARSCLTSSDRRASCRERVS